MNAIEKSSSIKMRTNIEELKAILIIEIDDILSNILVNLADNYPQAPASGGTPKMKEAITEVNRTDNPENDFIYNANIKIGTYLGKGGIPRDDADYTEYIMRVIDEAIQIAQLSKLDSR